MSEHVYEPSIFWALVSHAAQFATVLGPWFIVLGCSVWVLRKRSWPSYMALLSGVLILGAQFAHRTSTEIHTISFGNVMQPVVDENPVVVFIYLHGFTFGYALLGLALIGQFLRRQSVV